MSTDILLIDDDEAFLLMVSQVLRDSGFRVEATKSGRVGVERAQVQRFDLIVLDLVMPGMKGIEVCQALKQRSETAGVPILILTANDRDGQDIALLDMGADDYLTKPVKTERLLAHCRALLRRSPAKSRAGGESLKLGELGLDPGTKTVRLDGVEFAHLTPKEFELLYYLAAHSPQLQDRETLYREVWEMEPPSDGSLKTVEVHVRRIRLKLRLKSNHWLVTSPGRGYCVVPPKVR